MSCPRTKQEILDAIRKVNRELGITVVLVSHLPEVHEYLADRLILMEEGKIVDEGEPQRIIRKFLKDIEPPEEIKVREWNKPILKVRDLRKKFVLIKGGTVLEMENINFNVNQGEIVSIIGFPVYDVQWEVQGFKDWFRISFNFLVW